MTRESTVLDFLSTTDWSGAELVPLAGDASARRYFRLMQSRDTAILMDALPETCGSMAAFVSIANHLRGIGLAPPALHEMDLARGMIVMEDFGDDLVAARLSNRPQDETELYTIAVDILVHLNMAPTPKDIPVVDNARLAEMISPLFDHYAPDFSSRNRAIETLQDHLNALPVLKPTLALRDYHAENLVCRAGQAGIQHLGLLDFQDAILTNPLYDLASLLTDARRDVSPDVSAAMIERFVSGARLDPSAALANYWAIALQRNLRILGIFARLSKGGKPRYLDFMPRVWGHVQMALKAAELSAVFEELKPPETP